MVKQSGLATALLNLNPLVAMKIWTRELSPWLIRLVRQGLAMAAVLSLAMLAGCSYDPDNPNANVNPTRTAPQVGFLNGTTLISSNRTVARNSQLNIGWEVKRGSSALTLYQFVVRPISASGVFNYEVRRESQTGFPNDSYGDVEQFFIPNTGTYEVKVKGRDVNNLSDSTSFVLTVN